MVQARDLYLTSLATWRAVPSRAHAHRSQHRDQLRESPPAALARVVQQEPRKHVRHDRRRVLQAGPGSTGRGRQAHRRRAHRAEPERRLERAPPLRRPHVHAAERTARAGAARRRRPRPDVLAAARTRAGLSARLRRGPRAGADVRRRAMGERRDVRRAEACGSRAAAARRPVGEGVRRRSCGRGDPRDRGRLAARPLRLSCPAERSAAVARPRARRAARPRAERRAQRRGRGGLRSEAALRRAAPDRADPQPRVHPRAAARARTDPRVGRSRRGSPRRPVGARRPLDAARSHASVTGLAVSAGRLRVRGERRARPARPRGSSWLQRPSARRQARSSRWTSPRAGNSAPRSRGSRSVARTGVDAPAAALSVAGCA